MKKHNFFRSAGLFVMILIFMGVALTNISCSKKQEKVIKIGAILPLTGKAARYGKWIQEALELGREEINLKGGINGKKIDIIYEDDEANPKMATSAMKKLCEVNKVPIVFGSWASSCVLAQAPIAERTKTVLLAEAISPKIREAGDYTFRIKPDARYYIKKLVPFVYNTLKLRKIAILYVNNDFGVDQAKVFKEDFEKLGGKIIYESGFPQGCDHFRGEISKIKNIHPQGVFIPAYTEIAVFLKQAKEAKLKAQFMSSVPFENPDILKQAGIAAEGVIYPYHYVPDPNNKMDVEFRKKYKEKYGREPEGFAVLAYDGIHIIAEILKKCGVDRECLKSHLYKIQYIGVTGKTVFDEKGDPIKPIIIKTVRNGKFVKY